MLNSANDDLQRQTLEAYTLLYALRPAVEADTWPGALILNVTLDVAGAALSLAGNIAGAVCLTVDPDAARTRAALRIGACDFVVNTLDEALRAIKNEIRQRRPLSVGLEGEPIAILDEIVARGVAPQLFAAASEYPIHSARLATFGTRPLDLRRPEVTLAAPPYETAAALLQSVPGNLQWSAERYLFATPAEVRAFDSRALALLAPEDHLRRRWLTAAPRLFPRERTRILWLTPAEIVRLA